MLLIICADLSLDVGRIDPKMLDSQQVMELFFTPDDFALSQEGFGGSADDSCTWGGVFCDGDRNIVKIRWISWFQEHKGSVNFSFIPQTLADLHLSGHDEMRGEVGTSHLSPLLINFCLKECDFSGTLDMGSLPTFLETFVVQSNRITAVVNFVNLPSGLLQCDIGEQSVQEKEIYIGKLPATDLKIRLLGCHIQSVICESLKDAERVSLNFFGFHRQEFDA